MQSGAPSRAHRSDFPPCISTPHRPTHPGLRSPHQQPTIHFFALADPSADMSRTPILQPSVPQPHASADFISP
eukprot:5447981-Prymnesium_polylepis.1